MEGQEKRKVCNGAEIQKNYELARRLAFLVKEAGGSAYFVGGCVRDRLLGNDNTDVDIEIHGISPDSLERILDGLGERTEYGKSFGIYGLKGWDIDIAMPRMEKATGVGHRDFKVYVDPYIGLEKAAKRRDFTINAMMEDILTGKVEDFFGGKRDLKEKVIRHVCDESFGEDPLRVLRGAQFAARLDFAVAPETEDLCSRMDIKQLSGERVALETEKALLYADRPSVYFEVLRRMNQLKDWFPQVERLIGVPQSKHHQEGDVWVHTMMVVDEAAKRRANVKHTLGFMYSALCHDFGKAVSTEEINGDIHAYNHENDGLTEVEGFMKKLTNEKRLIEYVMNMCLLHMKPGRMAADGASVKSTNKLMDDSVCPQDLFQLSAADGLGKIPHIEPEEKMNFMNERYAIYEEIMERPYVMGKDLIEAGFIPNENFGQILEYAHKLRLAGIPKEKALKQVIGYANKFYVN